MIYYRKTLFGRGPKLTAVHAYAKDMKSGVMVNETGSFTFKLMDPKNLEICYTQVTASPKVASCFELTKK